MSLLVAGVALAAVPCTWTAAALLLDRVGHAPPAEGPYDAIVVPGCAVRAGGRPSDALARRTELAVSLWRQGHAPQIVLTGGVGDHGPAEAEVAADLARSLGVPDEALVLEDRSTSTEENAAFARRVHPVQRVLVATDTYHAVRCRWVFQRHFPRVAATGTPARPRTRLRWALREVVVLAVYALRGRLRLCAA